MDSNAQDTKFVTIELSKKQVDMESPKFNEKTGKNYVRVYAPGGGVIFYPAESIKIKKDNADRVYFVRPEGTELQINYSQRKEGVPDTAPNEEKYENYTRTVKIEDLKAMYDEERKSYAETHGFNNMSVPTEWGKVFESDGKKYVSISIPIPVNGNDEYYSFILPEERFKKSEREEGMSYFGFPKKKKDNLEEDYMIQMKTRERTSESEYQDKFMEISSNQLKEYVDAAKERSAVRDLFVSTSISVKLTREFESKDGKKLVDVSVPVYETDELVSYYSIVVPAERVRHDNDNFATLNLFKKGPDGEAYEFTAKKSVLNPVTNDYDVIQKKMTSEEVIGHFEISAARYRETHPNNEERTIADELNGENHTQNNPFNQNSQENEMPFRHTHRR